MARIVEPHVRKGINGTGYYVNYNTSLLKVYKYFKTKEDAIAFRDYCENEIAKRKMVWKDNEETYSWQESFVDKNLLIPKDKEDYIYVVKNIEKNIKWLFDNKKCFSEREKDIFWDYTVLLTLEKVAKKHNLTRERIKQIIFKTTKKLLRFKEYLIYGYENVEDRRNIYEKYQDLTVELENKLKEEAIKRLSVEFQRDFPNLFTLEERTKIINNAKEILPVDIAQLDLSVRTYNCLKRANINTVDEVIKLKFEDLIKIKNMGRKSAKEIMEKVASYKDGLTI